jgi:phosphate transport system permease protein
MNSLPLFIYTNVRSGEPVAISRAFGAATVLLGLVLILFTIARLLARPRRSSRRRLRPRRTRRTRPATAAPSDLALVPPTDPAHETYFDSPTREPL